MRYYFIKLVRSNKNNKIGFLNNFNRVCVAFSRAKIGLYIIGNIECIINGEKENKNTIDPKMNDVWQKIYTKAKSLNIIGDKLPLCCQTHGNEMVISDLKDFYNLSKEGGCKEKCNKKMKCGHLCQNICHSNYDCNKIECHQPCKRIKLYCSLNKHICQKLCYEKCDICEEIVDKELPCKHIKKGCKCYINPNLIKCEEIVDKELPCKHIKKGCKCYIDPNSIKCEEIVDKELPCKHIKKRCKCYINPNSIKCEEKCGRKLICKHFCQLKCYEDCNSQVCRQKIKFNICPHIKEIECFTFNYSDIFKNICKEKCNFKKKCNHPCKGNCNECLEGTLHRKCEEKCGKILLCGHKCKKKCFEECICEENSHMICHHLNKNFKCGDKIICKKKCDMKCKHGICNNKCGELCDREPCQKRCDKLMICGHQCFGLCGERCPDVCKICNPNDKYFLNIQENDLLYKTKCGHIFSVKEFDKYFYNNKRNIEIYRCSECNNILLNEPRYQNQIKILFMDIHKIKKMIINKYRDNKINIIIELIERIISRILEQYKKGSIRIFNLLPNNNINNNLLSYNKYNLKIKIPIIYNFINNININFTKFKLLTLAEKFMGIEYYMDYISNKNDMKNILRNEYRFIQNYLNIKKYFENVNEQNSVINDDFYHELKNKVDNMVYYLIARLNTNNGHLSKNQKLLDKASDIYNSNFSLKINLEEIYKKHYKKINIETTDLNRAFDVNWFKCKYGHYYYSTSKYDLITKRYKCFECVKEEEKNEEKKEKKDKEKLCMLVFCTCICIYFLYIFSFIFRTN